MIPTVTLPRGISVRAAADACRTALETFAVLEPTHVALVAWMSTFYRDALVEPRDARPLSLRFDGPIDRAIQNAKRKLAELRRDARNPNFITTIPVWVNIARVRDEDGDDGIVPIDTHGAGLEVRIVSLFLADYLSRPEHYITSATPERWWALSDA